MTQGLLRWAGVAATVAMLVSGCATTETGTALRDPNFDPDAVVPALLQPGNYPTTPQRPLGAAGPAGHLVESRRMADFTLLPFQVDPALTKSSGLGVGVIKDVGAVVKAFPPPVFEGADHNFVAGFTTLADNQGKQERSLQNAVLRFATPEDAAAAAADMHARSAAVSNIFNDEPRPTQPTGIPRYPDTRAVAWGGGTEAGRVLAFTHRGPLVLGQLTISIGGIEAAAEMVAATLDQQLPLLDRFVPTPVAELAALPLDDSGLVARTLPPPPDDRKVFQGSYGPHGILAFSNAPAVDQRLFDETGVTEAVMGHTTSYAARDAAGAARIVEQFATTMAEKGFQPAEGVPGLPSARCLQKLPPPESRGGTPVFYCAAAADAIAYEASAGQLADTHQMIAAQYLMLTAE